MVIVAAAMNNIAVASLRKRDAAAAVRQSITKSLRGFPFEALMEYNAPKRNNPPLSATSTTIMTPMSRLISSRSTKSSASA